MLWHNGKWKNDDDALFTINDRMRLGDGVFDTMLAVNGKAMYARAHMQRILHDADVMDISGDLPTLETLIETVSALLMMNEIDSGHHAINTLITRGAAEGALSIPEETAPNIVIRVRTVPHKFPGIDAVISDIRRNEGSPLSQIKSINYGDNILALQDAQAKDVNEAIMLNNAGNIACATSGNIFMEIDGTLFTPPLSDGVMAGVTRANLIEHFGAEEVSLSPKDLNRAEALYISNSIRGVCVVSSLDGRDLPPASSLIPKDFHLS